MVRSSRGPYQILAFMTIMAVLLFTAMGPILPGDGGSRTVEVPTPTRIFPEGFSADICTWSGNRTGALSLTYDDGLRSQAVNASPIMTLLGIRGTFFVTVGNVGNPYGASWPRWQEAVDNGHEIGSHTITHPDLRTLDPDDLQEEVVMSGSMIEQNLSGVECISFSYPMGLFNTQVMDLVRDTYIAARMDRHNISSPPGPVPPSPPDMFSIVPVNFGSGESVAGMNALVDDTARSGGWLVEMIHDVGDSGYEPVQIGDLTSHMTYISSASEDLWIAPFGEVTSYIRVRDASGVEMSMPNDEVCDISLDTSLETADLDVPVTLNISVPADWVDLVVYYQGKPTNITTSRGDGHRWFMGDIAPGHPLRLVKANRHPSIELHEAVQGSKLPFHPASGNSSESYSFFLNYSSGANRGPGDIPMVWLDLNGDGDLNDILNGVEESRVEMFMSDPLDRNYIDGCIYHRSVDLPPGTRLRIRFSAVDTEGLEGISTTGMGSWMDGPSLNDPPPAPEHIVLISHHDTSPSFNWTASIDPDGDDVTYAVRIFDIGMTETGSYVTEGTELSLHEELEFGREYILQIRSMDGRGGVSGPRELHFNLTNEPPPPVMAVIFSTIDTSKPSFELLTGDDPEGDPVIYRMSLFRMDGDLEVKVLEAMQWSNRTFIPALRFSDHTAYIARFSAEDVYGAASPVYVHELYFNLPPPPVTGLRAVDLENRENGLILFWDMSTADDLEGYLICRFDHDNAVTDPASPDSIINVSGSISHIDLNVTDGEIYRYGVVAVDMDGSFDLDMMETISVSPVDDVPPGRVLNIRVELLEPDEFLPHRFLLSWNISSDTRFGEYRIYRSGSPLQDVDGRQPLKVIDGRDTDSYEDLGFEPGLRYFYTVTAVDIHGNEETTMLSFVDIIHIPEAPPTPDPGREKEDNTIFYLGIASVVLLALMGAISYTTFILQGKRSGHGDEE